ncbi:MAG: LppX_LprAFG lipoprotein [Actinomycetota bacterium]
MSPRFHRVGAAIVVAIGLVGAFSGLLAAEGSDTEAAASADAAATVEVGPRLPANAEGLIDRAASAMAAVESVRFVVDRSGDPVFIDLVESIELDAVVGRFAAPADADAIVTVTIDGTLVTELGAVALGPDIWLSNPITGEFEPLPPSYDIDPSRFFDPTGGWQPLLAGLSDRTLVAADDAYHVRGIAPETELRRVTAGLVRADDVVVDLWLDPHSALVERVEFSVTDPRYGTSDWRIELSEYGEPFVISAPDGVDS